MILINAEFATKFEFYDKVDIRLYQLYYPNMFLKYLSN